MVGCGSASDSFVVITSACWISNSNSIMLRCVSVCEVINECNLYNRSIASNQLQLEYHGLECCVMAIGRYGRDGVKSLRPLNITATRITWPNWNRMPLEWAQQPNEIQHVKCGLCAWNHVESRSLVNENEVWNSLRLAAVVVFFVTTTNKRLHRLRNNLWFRISSHRIWCIYVLWTMERAQRQT